MHLRPILTQGEWWDDSPTIRLYHGTSSVNVPDIQQNGMRPIDVTGFASTYANSLVPQHRQSKWLRGMLDRLYGNDALRSGDRGCVLYFFTEASAVEGYARGYAQHGAELACDVLCYVNAERKDRKRPPLPPRFPEGLPVVIEVEIPKDWCLWSTSPERQRTRIESAWKAGEEWISDYPTLAAALREAMHRVEVRVAQTIPPEMIVSIRTL